MNDWMGTYKNTPGQRGLGSFAAGMASASREQLARLRAQQVESQQRMQDETLKRDMMMQEMQNAARQRAAGLIPPLVGLGLPEAAGEAWGATGLPGKPPLNYDPMAKYRAQGSASDELARQRLGLSAAGELTGKYDPEQEKNDVRNFEVAMLRLDPTARGQFNSWRSKLDATDWTQQGTTTKERLAAVTAYFRTMPNISSEADAKLERLFAEKKEQIFNSRPIREKLEDYLSYIKGGAQGE